MCVCVWLLTQIRVEDRPKKTRHKSFDPARTNWAKEVGHSLFAQPKLDHGAAKFREMLEKFTQYRDRSWFLVACEKRRTQHKK